jgi:hypothetical protein
MFTILFTFVLTVLGLAALAVFLLRRVAAHVRDNPEAVEAISKHVLLPLFSGRRTGPEDSHEP